MTLIADRPVLVAGAAGTMGMEVVRALRERGAQVRAIVHGPERAAALPSGVEPFVADLEDRAEVASAFQEVAAAFFLSPHEEREERIAENFVAACEAAGARLVFAGVHAHADTALGRFLVRKLFQWYAPHYRGKIRIAERVRTSRTRAVMIGPGAFFQNEEIFRADILSGIYPLPMRLLQAVDVRDIGDAAARALLDESITAGYHPVVGPASLTGDQVAADWTAALGFEVRYAPDLERVDRAVQQHYRGRKALDYRLTYRSLGKFSEGTTSGQLEQTNELLGRPPRSHLEYAIDTAAKWLATV
jgi:uncharacterized protein YbjT (DUF2867 family)